MYGVATLITILLVVTGLIYYFNHSVMTPENFVTENFAVAAVHPTLMPACVERSEAAQKLLTRIASFPDSVDAAEELRLLVSKLCCLEADISTPAAGGYRTQALQFRTSHDMEPASTFVGRCMRNTVQKRDIDLIVEKFGKRGLELIQELVGACPDAKKEFEDVLLRTQMAMMSFCQGGQPSMDKPLGVRDMGFWEPENVAVLDQYQGISAVRK
jgi:hypothetical protein